MTKTETIIREFEPELRRAGGALLSGLALILSLIAALGVVTLSGCDSPETCVEVDEPEPEPDDAVLDSSGGSDDGLDTGSSNPHPIPTRVDAKPVRIEGGLDPCAGYGPDPGVTLTNGTAFPGEVLVPDLCIGVIPNIDGCWVSNSEDFDGLLDLWCDFVCDGAIETSSTVVGYPPVGFDVRIVHVNPCPTEGAP